MKLRYAKGHDVPGAQPDPFIFEHDGVFYIYATHGQGVQVYKSTNFTDWEYKGLLFSREGFLIICGDVLLL